MVVMIVIGWAVALPLFVVLGLFCAAKVLGRRARGAKVASGTDMTSFARQFQTARSSSSPAPAGAGQPASQSVSAGY
jgi:hypothetical protein